MKPPTRKQTAADLRRYLACLERRITGLEADGNEEAAAFWRWEVPGVKRKIEELEAGEEC